MSCRRLPMPISPTLSRCLAAGWLCIGLASVELLSGAERYFAMTTSGRRISQFEIQDWSDPDGNPTIAAHAIFDEAEPARWIVDRTQPPGPLPAAWVELTNGDCLAGETRAYVAGGVTPYDPQPAHLIVQTAGEFHPPDRGERRDARVAVDCVRRIVWQRLQAGCQPGTAFLRNGGRLPYRTIRWATDGCTLLTADGLKEVAWNDLAELHLPRQDGWDAWLDQLAVLGADEQSRVVQQQLSDGSLLTTSRARFRPLFWGDRAKPEAWLQQVQPAWSLDPLWVRYRSIRTWRFFAPNEVPLTAVLPEQVERQAVFGNGWPEQIDRSVQGKALRVAGLDAGWGLGVQGGTTLTYALPAAARGLRFKYGLTAEAGSGGCVSFRVQAGASEELLQREFVVGSQQLYESPLLTFEQAESASRTLSLHADMAQSGRPAGADPFDIRDSAAWLDPEVLLEPELLRREIATRSVLAIPGLSGWQVPSEPATPVVVESLLDPFDNRERRFRTVLRPARPFFVASRKVKVPPNAKWLALAISRYPELLRRQGLQPTSPSSVQIRVDGRTWCDVDVPVRRGLTDPDPVLVPLDAVAGKTATVDVILFPQDEHSFVDWRGMALVDQPPGLRRVFEEEPEFAVALSSADVKAQLSPEDPYSGMTSVRVPPGAGEGAVLPGLDVQIAEQPRLGEYRYIVFAWKKEGGARVELQLAADGRLGAEPAARGGRSGEDRGLKHRYAYDAGAQKETAGSPRRLEWRVPTGWSRQERDLFDDFGEFLLTGLALRAVDGKAAWLDHVYLARTSADMTRLRESGRPAGNADGDPTVLARADQRAEYGPLLSRVAPGFGCVDVRGGLILRSEFAGQREVLETHPPEPDRPFTMRGVVSLPAARKSTLELVVTHAAKADWQLVVQVNGKPVQTQLIDAALTESQGGWATISVDLSAWAGQTVLLEIQAASNDWNNESAFWKRIHVVSE